MSIRFDLLLPQRLVFGWGERRQLGSLAVSLGRRAFLIDGSRTLRKTEIWNELLARLQAAGVSVEHIATAEREPTIEDVDRAARRVLELQPGPNDFVLGIGGGSALDLAKAVAAMATNGTNASVRDFLEGIGTGRQLDVAPLRVLAVPTTAGTGSEATKNAVISCNNPPCKKSLRGEQLMPAIVLWDAELTVSLPAKQTAYSGLDAITQLIESYTSKRSQPVTESLCDMGLKLGLGSLVKAVHFPKDRQAREEMASAALLSGMALANSGLGMAHGVAAALGAVCDVPHGLACAVMLPIALRTNREMIEARLERLTIIWKTLKQNARAGMDAPAVTHLTARIADINHALQIPTRLRELGVLREQIPELVKGSRGNSMNGNPRELSDDELTQILEENW